MTLRVYCTNYISPCFQEPIEEQFGGCMFGLTFRFDPQGLIWVLHDKYNPLKHAHSHPFFYNFKNEPLTHHKHYQRKEEDAD